MNDMKVQFPDTVWIWDLGNPDLCISTMGHKVTFTCLTHTHQLEISRVYILHPREGGVQGDPRVCFKGAKLRVQGFVLEVQS